MKKCIGEECSHCKRAARVLGFIDTIMKPRDGESNTKPLRWAAERLMRWVREQKAEREAARRAKLVPKWQPIPDENRCRRRDPWTNGLSGSTSDLDDIGSYGPALRAYEDRFDER